MKNITFPLYVYDCPSSFWLKTNNCREILYNKYKTIQADDPYIVINEDKSATINVHYIEQLGWGESSATESDDIKLTDEEFFSLIETYKMDEVYKEFQKRETAHKKKMLKAIYQEMFG